MLEVTQERRVTCITVRPRTPGSPRTPFAGTRGPMAAIEGLDVSAYTIPTDAPESDGTMEWDSTTIVVVQARAGGRTGLGYTYGDVSVARFVESMLEGVVRDRDPLAPLAAWAAMRDAVRNAGR